MAAATAKGKAPATTNGAAAKGGAKKSEKKGESSATASGTATPTTTVASESAGGSGKIEKPDKKKYDDEQNALRAEIDEKQAKRVRFLRIFKVQAVDTSNFFSLPLNRTSLRSKLSLYREVDRQGRRRKHSVKSSPRSRATAMPLAQNCLSKLTLKRMPWRRRYELSLSDFRPVMNSANL